MSDTAWEELLSAQGVPREKIDDAKRAARHMADALKSVQFTPADPIAPDQFGQILGSGARKAKRP